MENNADCISASEGEGVTGAASGVRRGSLRRTDQRTRRCRVELEEKVRLAKAAQAEQLELLEKLDDGLQLSATYTTMTDPAATGMRPKAR